MSKDLKGNTKHNHKQKLKLSIIALIMSILVTVLSFGFIVEKLYTLSVLILWAMIIIIIINSCFVFHYKKATRKYCQKCGKKFTKEEYTVFPGKLSRSGNLMKMKVQFRANCRSCYNKQEFYKKFDFISLDDGMDYNCLEKAEDYISGICK